MASTVSIPAGPSRAVRLAYVVSHPIQYQAPLLRRIAQEKDIDLTVLFGSDFSVRGYRDEGFGVDVAWDVPLLDGYKSEFLPTVRDNGTVSATAPVSRGIYRRLQNAGGVPAFDAVWVHGYSSVNALQAIAAARALGIPVLLRAEPWLGDRARSGIKLAVKDTAFRWLGSVVAGVLPIGRKNAEYWRHYWGDRVPQFLMPYAVDNAYFARLAAQAAPRREELRRELELQPGRPVVLFASKLQTRKHADHLVQAYAELVRSGDGPEPYLVVVGDGEERARLEKMAVEAGLNGVRFTGFRNQSELPRFYDLADVFVLPSQHEPWGLIVNEAMASGTAVVVSDDVGSAYDLVTDGVEGCMYPFGDIAALAGCLRRVLADSRRMGENARARMRTWSFEEDIAGLRAALAHVTRKLRA